MRNLPDSFVRTRSTHATASANTAVTITLAADATELWTIFRLTASYSGTPSGSPKITITFGSTVLYEVDLTGQVLWPDSFPPSGLQTGVKNEAVTVTLAAGGAGVVGKLNITYA